jgi:ethanolamine utilization protein EutN
MQLGAVIGHATATVKHPSLVGWRMVIVQPLNNARQPEADPVVAVDKLGSAPGSVVVLNSDGKGARELIGDDKSPVRWFVIGIVDGEGE